jgi:translocation and assembly module TamB
VIKAPKNIWVKGTDINAELGLSDGFRIAVVDRALMYGEIRFLRGRVDVMGRRFDVMKDSQVRFGGPVKVPYVNLAAQYLNEREQVTVFTTVRGQGKDISVRVSSQPALSESEIYTLLATGRRNLKRGSGSSMSSSDAATVATSFAASQLKHAIGSKIPLDVISFEAGSNGLTDASGEAGTYFTDDLYLGYHFRLGADPTRENTHSVRLEYQLSPRWSLDTEYGDARQGGADLIWSKDY